MIPEEITTAFMISVMDGTKERLDELFIGRKIHAAIQCPQPDGSLEWAVSVIPVGRVIGWENGDLVKVTMELLHGEVDTV